jgi:membrane protease YdiL (CAAX protease family)
MHTRTDAQMGSMNGGRSAAIWRIFLAAFCWWVLALLPEILFSVALGAGLFRGTEEARRAVVDVTEFAASAIVLFAAFVQGRSTGGGDPWVGIGYAPLGRTPIIISMATLVVIYTLLVDILRYHYHYNPAPFDQLSDDTKIGAWLGILTAFEFAILGPISEELFFRGWLWTALRKQWSPLATAAATGGAWLIMHFWVSFATPFRLLPFAVVLSFARYFGGSVKASIALHVLYNSMLTVLPWLFLKLV